MNQLLSRKSLLFFGLTLLPVVSITSEYREANRNVAWMGDICRRELAEIRIESWEFLSAV